MKREQDASSAFKFCSKSKETESMTCCSSYVSSVFFSSRRRHTRWPRDWSSDVCSSDLVVSSLCSPHSDDGAGAELAHNDRRAASRSHETERQQAHHRMSSHHCALLTVMTRSEERRVGKSVELGRQHNTDSDSQTFM